MRKNRFIREQTDISILALDDDKVMTMALQSFFQASGFHVDTENDPTLAVERVRAGKYDILLLDFLMSPICGDEVVSRIREFNKELTIILLTGHKSLAPPIKTIRELDIQGYYEKSDRFDQLELLVESCVKSIRQMRTIRNYRDKLGKIVAGSPEIYKLQPRTELMATLFAQAEQIYGIKNGFLVTCKKEKQASESETPACGFFGAGAYGDFGEEARALALRIRGGEKLTSIPGRGGEACCLFPLINESHELFGLFGAEIPSEHQTDTLGFVGIFVRQISSAISNMTLHALVREKNEELQKAYARLQKNYAEMTGTVRSMVDARDIYTRGHSDRVSYYALLIAKSMNKDEAFLNRIRVAGLLHDIGKIGVPDHILLKNASLTDEEFNVIKRHPGYGYRMLSATSLYQEIAPIVMSHHERIDGKGYPKGLSGKEIPEEARMITVADAFDAMTSHRRYRENMSLSAAMEQLLRGRGAQFDAGITDAFLEVLKDYDTIQKEVAWTYEEAAAQ